MTIFIDTHEGRSFESSGVMVTPETIVAYLGNDNRLTDWHGRTLGTYREVAKWRINSWLSTHMYQVEATVDGVTYTGRSHGKGMLFRGKAKKAWWRS